MCFYPSLLIFIDAFYFLNSVLSRSSGWPRESAKRPFRAFVTGKETEVGVYPESLGEAEAELISNQVS